MALLIAKRYEESSDGKYMSFDFVFSKLFEYNGFEVINIFDEFGVYISDVDRGAIQVYSDLNSVFSVLLFDIWPLPENVLESMNFINSHIFKDFRRIDSNVYQRITDELFYYETGIDLLTMKIRRLGNIGEVPCKVRMKTIWHKI